MATLRWVLTLAVAGVFGWSSLVKIARPERWAAAVRGYRLAQPVKRVAVLVVPWLELGIALAVVTGRSRAGGVFALLVLVTFSGAIIRLQRILATKAVPCGCLGGNANRDYRVLLARNGLLAAAALVLAVFAPPDHGWGWHPAASAGATVLAVAVLIGAATVWALWCWTVWYARVRPPSSADASVPRATPR
jgi:hypothetical protein